MLSTFFFLQLCSMLYEYKEGYSALKREGWDMSQYSRVAKETGHSFEFEPRSISKDFRASTRIKPNKKKREKEYKSSISLDERPGMELVSKSLCMQSTHLACVCACMHARIYVHGSFRRGGASQIFIQV